MDLYGGLFWRSGSHHSVGDFAGLMYDMFYTGIIGVFLVLFPLMIYITRWIMQYFEPSFIVLLLIYLIDITVYINGSFIWNEFDRWADVSVDR